VRERFGPLTFKGWVYLVIAVACAAFWYAVIDQAFR
jgi:hypothetical protein